MILTDIKAYTMSESLVSLNESIFKEFARDIVRENNTKLPKVRDKILELINNKPKLTENEKLIRTLVACNDLLAYPNDHNAVSGLVKFILPVFRSMKKIVISNLNLLHNDLDKPIANLCNTYDLDVDMVRVLCWQLLFMQITDEKLQKEVSKKYALMIEGIMSDEENSIVEHEPLPVPKTPVTVSTDRVTDPKVVFDKIINPVARYTSVLDAIKKGTLTSEDITRIGEHDIKVNLLKAVEDYIVANSKIKVKSMSTALVLKLKNPKKVEIFVKSLWMDGNQANIGLLVNDPTGTDFTDQRFFISLVTPNAFDAFAKDILAFATSTFLSGGEKKEPMVAKDPEIDFNEGVDIVKFKNTDKLLRAILDEIGDILMYGEKTGKFTESRHVGNNKLTLTTGQGEVLDFEVLLTDRKEVEVTIQTRYGKQAGHVNFALLENPIMIKDIQKVADDASYLGFMQKRTAYETLVTARVATKPTMFTDAEITEAIYKTFNSRFFIEMVKKQYPEVTVVVLKDRIDVKLQDNTVTYNVVSLETDGFTLKKTVKDSSEYVLSSQEMKLDYNQNYLKTMQLAQSLMEHSTKVVPIKKVDVVPVESFKTSKGYLLQDQHMYYFGNRIEYVYISNIDKARNRLTYSKYPYRTTITNGLKEMSLFLDSAMDEYLEANKQWHSGQPVYVNMLAAKKGIESPIPATPLSYHQMVNLLLVYKHPKLEGNLERDKDPWYKAEKFGGVGSFELSDGTTIYDVHGVDRSYVIDQKLKKQITDDFIILSQTESDTDKGERIYLDSSKESREALLAQLKAMPEYPTIISTQKVEYKVPSMDKLVKVKPNSYYINYYMTQDGLVPCTVGSSDKYNTTLISIADNNVKFEVPNNTNLVYGEIGEKTIDYAIELQYSDNEFKKAQEIARRINITLRQNFNPKWLKDNIVFDENSRSDAPFSFSKACVICKDQPVKTKALLPYLTSYLGQFTEGNEGYVKYLLKSYDQARYLKIALNKVGTYDLTFLKGEGISKTVMKQIGNVASVDLVNEISRYLEISDSRELKVVGMDQKQIANTISMDKAIAKIEQVLMDNVKDKLGLASALANARTSGSRQGKDNAIPPALQKAFLNSLGQFMDGNLGFVYINPSRVSKPLKIAFNFKGNFDLTLYTNNNKSKIDKQVADVPEANLMNTVNDLYGYTL